MSYFSETLPYIKFCKSNNCYPTCCPLVRFSHIASKMLRAGHARFSHILHSIASKMLREAMRAGHARGPCAHGKITGVGVITINTDFNPEATLFV